MKKKKLRTLFFIIGLILLSYGFTDGMEFSKLLSCVLGGGMIGLSTH